MEEKETQAPRAMATLLGGSELTVTRHDGTTEMVRVRALPVNELQKLAERLDDEPAQVELYCSKPAGWALELCRDSYEKVVIEGEALNNDFFMRWLQRQRARQERLVPGITEKLADKILAFQNSLPRSP